MNDKPPLWTKNPENKGIELHYAAYSQDLKRVKECVEAGYDVNQKARAMIGGGFVADENGWTPIIWCVFMAATGKIGAAEAIVDYLLKHGANFDLIDDRYNYILEFAEKADCHIAKHIKGILEK
jgi:ankyrin repeat protein